MSRDVTKPTKRHVRPARTQISLDIRPVWSESSLSAWKNLGSLDTQWAHSEDSDQTGRMPRLICLRWVHTHFVGFVTLRLKYRLPVNVIRRKQNNKYRRFNEYEINLFQYETEMSFGSHKCSNERIETSNQCLRENWQYNWAISWDYGTFRTP